MKLFLQQCSDFFKMCLLCLSHILSKVGRGLVFDVDHLCCHSYASCLGNHIITQDCYIAGCNGIKVRMNTQANTWDSEHCWRHLLLWHGGLHLISRTPVDSIYCEATFRETFQLSGRLNLDMCLHWGFLNDFRSSICFETRI